MTPTENPNKPFRLRIPPTSPREKHVFSDGTRFERVRGWYPIGADEKVRFEQARLFDTSSASPLLFQIVTAERALEIDIEEGRAGAGVEQKQAAREAAMRAEMDATRAELAKVNAIVSSQGAVIAAQAAAIERFQASMERFVVLAEQGVLRAGGVAQAELDATPATERKGAQPNAATSAPALAASTEDAKPADDEDARATRPQRPGETKSKGGKPKGASPAEKDSAKPAESASPAEPTADGMGAGEAAAAHDAALRASGATPNR